jgi:hypothetical protein
MVTPVLSGRMRPGLAVGGVAISQRVRVGSLAARDVIVFADPYGPSEQVAHPIAHIAIGKSGRILVNAQGDANTVHDPWAFTTPGGCVYRVRRSVPLIGHVAIACRNQRGLFLLGAGIVLILIAVSTVSAQAKTYADDIHGAPPRLGDPLFITTADSGTLSTKAISTVEPSGPRPRPCTAWSPSAVRASPPTAAVTSERWSSPAVRPCGRPPRLPQVAARASQDLALRGPTW